MAYETYTTEALVCGFLPRGEHDATVRLLTKEAGMLYARAGGIRAEVSKLRYSLQPFSYSTVSLVRGRHEWRVVGAMVHENFYYTAHSREARGKVFRGTQALIRFIQGAEADARLFACALDGVRSLAHHEATNEDVFLLRVLHLLGYVAPSGVPGGMIEASNLLDASVLCTPHAVAREVREMVSAALAATHL